MNVHIAQRVCDAHRFPLWIPVDSEFFYVEQYNSPLSQQRRLKTDLPLCYAGDGNLGRAEHPRGERVLADGAGIDGAGSTIELILPPVLAVNQSWIVQDGGRGARQRCLSHRHALPGFECRT